MFSFELPTQNVRAVFMCTFMNNTLASNHNFIQDRLATLNLWRTSVLSLHHFHSGAFKEAAIATFLGLFLKELRTRNHKMSITNYEKNMWNNKMFQLAVRHTDVDSCPSRCNDSNIHTSFSVPIVTIATMSVTLIKIATLVRHNFCDSNTRISSSVTILAIATLIFACTSQLLR